MQGRTSVRLSSRQRDQGGGLHLFGSRAGNGGLCPHRGVEFLSLPISLKQMGLWLVSFGDSGFYPAPSAGSTEFRRVPTTRA